MSTEPSTTSTVLQGGITVTAVAFLHNALAHMIPYAIAAVPLILLDLLWGIRAAKYRKERVTFSRAFRKTMGKCMDYTCWLIIAASLGVAFDARWVEWLLIGAVMFNEITSIVGNYLETKDMQLSLVGLFRWLFKVGADKVGAGITKDDAAEIIQPKPKQPVAKKCGIDIEVLEKEETE